MTTAENSLLYFENGQDFVPMSALTDAGDFMTYNSSAEIWSDEAGFSPVIKPDGVPVSYTHLTLPTKRIV